MATFYTGATGRGTGPHLDFRVFDVEKGDYVNPTGFSDILQVGGKPLTEQFQMTSGFGPRQAPVAGASTYHLGLDYGTPEGTEVNVLGGRHISTFKDKGGGIMSQIGFQRDGRNYEALLLHGSDKNSITSGAAITDYDPSAIFSDAQAAPTTSVVGGTDPKEKAQDMLQKKVEMVKATPTDVVKGFGNDFGDMKSNRLGDALRGAQEAIVQQRMKQGEEFGMIKKS